MKDNSKSEKIDGSKDFLGFKPFSSGQKEPKEYIKRTSRYMTSLYHGELREIKCLYGFNSAKDANLVVEKQKKILPKANFVMMVPPIKGRNYVLEVFYPLNVSFDIVIEDSKRLKKKYHATDVSIIPIPQKLARKVYKIFGRKNCPFLAMIKTN
jgi:hypothetical protein